MTYQTTSLLFLIPSAFSNPATPTTTPALGVLNPEKGFFPPYGGPETSIDVINAAMGITAFPDILRGTDIENIGYEISGCLEDLLFTVGPDDLDSDDITPMLPEPNDMFADGALVRTRDALIWTCSEEITLNAPINVYDYLDPLMDVNGKPDHMALAIDQAFIAAGLPAPDEDTMSQYLGSVYIGTYDAQNSGHALIAQHARISEDSALFSEILSAQGCDRPNIITIIL